MVQNTIISINDLIYDFTQEEELRNINSEDITNVFNRSDLEQIKWLSKTKLIKNSVICDTCQADMTLVLDNLKRTNYKWHCICGKSESILNNFFMQYRVEVKKLVKTLYFWAGNSDLKTIAKESKVSIKIAGRICKNIREIVFTKMLTVNEQIGGVGENGEGLIVEIDKSLFCKRKYHRGRFTREVWVLGGIERKTRKCFMLVVNDRSADTLLSAIERFVRPGTTIITDGWRSYRKLGETNNYTHKVIIHERNFVSPDDPLVHTQCIENLWLHAKRKIKAAYGFKGLNMEFYLSEFMFRHQKKDNMFAATLKLIG